MKFANLQFNNAAFIALVDTDSGRFWPVADLVPGFSGDMIQLVHDFDRIKSRLDAKGEGQPLAQAKVLAPIAQPRRNIFCVGKNYHEHAREFSQSGFDSSAAKGEVAPTAPVVFTKAPSSAVGHGATVERHAGVTEQLDYEAELGVIIGKPGRGIAPADAWSHIAGYTVINDVTARDLQHKHRQWFLGKSMDTFCPMGPWIVTADGVDGANLDVRCWINGELRQDANTRDLIFDIPTLIATLSAGIALQPGDVIATGTPAGVGIGFKPPRFLQSGDEMKVEIQHVGTLVNRVG